jgi:hypothetical protein
MNESKCFCLQFIVPRSYFRVSGWQTIRDARKKLIFLSDLAYCPNILTRAGLQLQYKR